MSRTVTAPLREVQGVPDEARLRQVFEAARRLVAYRERAAALAARDLHPPSLAEAIDRDFLAFDIGRAERALRAAVIAADPDRAPLWLAEPELRDRHAEQG